MRTTSIPSAVISTAVLRFVRGSNILENNIGASTRVEQEKTDPL